MSEITVDKINNSAGTGAANFTYGIKVGGVAQSIGSGTFTSSDTEPSSPSDGDIWYQPTLRYLDYRAGGEWKRVIGSGTSNPPAYFGDRMLVAGGGIDISPYRTSAIRYIDLTGSGGSTNFGSLTSSRNGAHGATGDTRGIFAGGVISNYINNIEYVTIPTTGNSTDFGDLTEIMMASSASDGTYAIFALGDGANAYNGSISQITIATTGNATSWSGTLTTNRGNGSGASDGTKGFFFGGYETGYVNTIDYVTIATDANATDWGDLIVARNGSGDSACGTNSRVLTAGGQISGSKTDAIEYINPASASNAYDFGNLTSQMGMTTSACNSTKACWVGGTYTNGVKTDTQQIVTIDTTGNASAFGTYSIALQSGGSCSGAAS